MLKLFLILLTSLTFAQSPFWKMELMENETAPSVVTSPSAVGDVNKVTLTWTDPTESDFDSVRIYAGTSANPTTWVASVPKGTQSYKDSNYSYNTIRHYRLKAKDKSNNLSAYTSSVNDTVNMWLGSELILNGTFSSTSNWTVTGGTSNISGGTANLITADGSGTAIYQSAVPCTTGNYYYTSFDVVVTAGAVSFYYQNTSYIFKTVNTSGSYSAVFTPSANNSFYAFTRSGITNANIDNVSLKRILNP